MSKYFFDTEEERKCIVPFEHFTEERARYHRLENSNMPYKIEVLDSDKALSELHTILCTMIVVCRGSKDKCITLDEEDLSLLFEIAGKQKSLDVWRL